MSFQQTKEDLKRSANLMTNLNKNAFSNKKGPSSRLGSSRSGLMTRWAEVLIKAAAAQSAPEQLNQLKRRLLLQLISGCTQFSEARGEKNSKEVFWKRKEHFNRLKSQRKSKR